MQLIKIQLTQLRNQLTITQSKQHQLSEQENALLNQIYTIETVLRNENERVKQEQEIEKEKEKLKKKKENEDKTKQHKNNK